MPVTPAFEREGYTIVPGVASPDLVQNLIEAVDRRLEENRLRGAADKGHSLRNLAHVVSEVAAFASSSPIKELLHKVFGRPAFPVRSLLFDKTSAANWRVAWHQDTTIAVREKIEMEGFGAWSVKDGVTHVQPPVSILEGMLTIRLHLDDCNEDNGPLEVLPGSHRNGRMNAEAIQSCRQKVRPVACVVPSGGAVVLRPLLLHSSRPAQRPGHRRVVHLEFAADPLPGGLEWIAPAFTTGAHATPDH